MANRVVRHLHYLYFRVSRISILVDVDVAASTHNAGLQGVVRNEMARGGIELEAAPLFLYGRGSCNPDWVPLPPDTDEDVTEKFDLPLTVQTITAHKSLILTTWKAIPMDTRAAVRAAVAKLCPSIERRFAKGRPIKHAMVATLSNARKTWESRHLQELASMMHVTSLPLLARLVRTKRQEEFGEPGLDSSDSGAESEDDDDEEPLDQATRAALLDEMMYD
ncbi:BQ5605_C011g06457 [Microbotryum silenes-dioicae]|uniref:BQ5605_C011g06457 protein n=1 Tax=Microbotryum silenes-dioicae TaxID=796604 RepID=A0A2X0MIB2_9BASI|nr:BQ5605_C011g06457 [Microbotryum silenes-dioicae]